LVILADHRQGPFFPVRDGAAMARHATGRVERGS
jgi:hypothetical protein